MKNYNNKLSSTSPPFSYQNYYFAAVCHSECDRGISPYSYATSICTWNTSSCSSRYILPRLRDSSTILDNPHDKTVGKTMVLCRNRR